MDFLAELLAAFFSDPMRDDKMIKLAVAVVIWRELHSMRRAMEAGFRALTDRIDNHEKRLRALEPGDDTTSATTVN